MITVKSERPIFDMPYAEVLDIDTIPNLKEGFGMMGMRFMGKPSKAAIKREESQARLDYPEREQARPKVKADIVKAYDEYVKGNPVDYNTDETLKTPLDAVIDMITKDRMDAMEEAQRAEREDGPVKFLPAFTKHPAKYPPMKESYCATRKIRVR